MERPLNTTEATLAVTKVGGQAPDGNNTVTIASLALFEVEATFLIPAFLEKRCPKPHVRIVCVCQDGTTKTSNKNFDATPGTEQTVTISCTSSCSNLLILSAHLLDKDNVAVCDPVAGIIVRQS